MSVEIGIAALSMSESLNSLKSTPLPMHRIWVEIGSVEIWYKIIAEANREFGIRGWRCQSGTKRRLDRQIHTWPSVLKTTVRVWFDVPDEKFATWIAIKYPVTVLASSGK
jgi:hypothetical protein